MSNCEVWLSLLIRNYYCGMAIVDEVREEAKKNGFTKKQLKDARLSLGVKTVHGFDEDGRPTQNWYWCLP